MRYRNKRTGVVIHVKSNIAGPNWEKVEEVKRASSGSRGRKGKKDG